MTTPIVVLWSLASIVCADIDHCDVYVHDTFESQRDCRMALLDTKHPDPEAKGTLAGRDCLRLRWQPAQTSNIRPTRKPETRS